MPELKKVKNGNEKGMTLIEVMAALVLLVILATSIIAVFTPASMWIQQARNETTASNYARAVLENLRADRTQISTANNDKSADALWPGHIYKPAGLPGMNAVVNIKPRSIGFFDVMVTVSWSEGSTPRQLKMLTVMRAN